MVRWVLQTSKMFTKENLQRSNKVCFISYNSRGFSSFKSEFIRKLASQEIVGDKLPVICNQENFILRDNSYKLTSALPGFQVLINPAVKNNHDRGRPKNGMFIAFPDEIKNNVIDVSPGYWRLQAVKIKFGSATTLLINSYFPVDPRRPNADDTELQETLGHIRNVIRNNDFDTLLWAGDLNADFLRNTGHTSTILDCVEEMSLTKSWDIFEVDFTCCHELLGVSHVSTLDHFFWSETLCEHVIDAGVIHLPEDKSDHSPVYCVVEFSNIEHHSPSQVQQKPKPSWKKSKKDQQDNFQIELESKLSQLISPLSVTSCRDVRCQDQAHRDDLDNFTIELLETVQQVAEQNLFMPSTTPNQVKKRVPGWKEAVEPFREKAYFWHQIWDSLGRPLNTEIHHVMKRSKNKYHYEYHKCRKAEERVKKSKLLNACLNGEGDLFGQIKCLRKSQQSAVTSIDGVTDHVEEHFKSKYEELFNSAGDGVELLKVQKEAEEKVDHQSLEYVDKVTPDLVKQASHKLKSGKSDPVYSFSSDCFKNGSESMYEKLSSIIQSFLIHGHVTNILLLATLVPLIKDKLGSPNSSKNYRSIAISSILLKLIDWIFLLLFGVHFGLNDFQFAYQAGCSTTMCTWAVLETVELFLNNGSEVFSCAMDMTKAFDLTLHSLLFRKMIAAGFPVIFVRLFIFIYVQQVANVRWNGEVSSTFPMTNGVRQGAVLSAIAYCFYCENLFALLKQRRTGCWVLGRYHGIFGYSDDNWLLAPSLNALQDMLLTCEEYAASHNLKFSTDPNPTKCKTKLMAFLKKPSDLPSLKLCGNPLPWVTKLKHLGNTISNQLDGNQLDVKVKAAKLIDKNNSICQEFYFAHPETKVKLNNIYNNHFTGSQLWKFGTREFEKLIATCNRSVKIMYDLPWGTHRYFMEPLTGLPHTSRILAKRYLSFIEKIQNSSKTALKMLLQTVQNDVRHTTGFNLRTLMILADKTRIWDLRANLEDFQYHNIPDEEKWRINMLRELVNVKENECTVPGLEENELNEILEYICTG